MVSCSCLGKESEKMLCWTEHWTSWYFLWYFLMLLNKPLIDFDLAFNLFLSDHLLINCHDITSLIWHTCIMFPSFYTGSTMCIFIIFGYIEMFSVNTLVLIDIITCHDFEAAIIWFPMSAFCDFMSAVVDSSFLTVTLFVTMPLGLIVRLSFVFLHMSSERSNKGKSKTKPARWYIL